MGMATYRKVRRLSRAEAAYIAGVIDGEGTISLTRKHRGEFRQLAVSISSTERTTTGLRAEGRGRRTYNQ